MKHIIIFIVPIFLILSGCSNSNELQHEPVQSPVTENKIPPSLVIDLNAVTTRIVDLIKKGNVAEIISKEVNQSPGMVDILVKNFSPAEMAFDSEVLNFSDIAVVLFYDATEPTAQEVQAHFENIAFYHRAHGKFFKIDVSHLFKLADQASVSTVPSVLAIQHKKELGRIEQRDPALLETDIAALLAKIGDTCRSS